MNHQWSRQCQENPCEEPDTHSVQVGRRFAVKDRCFRPAAQALHSQAQGQRRFAPQQSSGGDTSRESTHCANDTSQTFVDTSMAQRTLMMHARQVYARTMHARLMHARLMHARMMHAKAVLARVAQFERAASILSHPGSLASPFMCAWFLHASTFEVRTCSNHAPSASNQWASCGTS